MATTTNKAENVEEDRSVERDPEPSYFPEFAHCFSFFKKFGAYLSLPDITLNELERFFKHGDLEDVDETLVNVQYNLLSSVTRRPIDKETWIVIAARLAYSNGFIEGTSDYEDFDVLQKIQLLKFLCDMQFIRNTSFKNCLSKIPESDDSWWREKPVGLDRQGLRYWYLQDSTFNVRVYSEDKYLEYPFDHPKWNLVCSSVDELEVLIDKMEKGLRNESLKSEQENTLPEDASCRKAGSLKNDTSDPDQGEKATKKRRISSRTKKNKEGVGGCIVCGKDTFYSKILLCDKCDRECHTFCQYPIVWSIPDGDWYCPTCRELELVESLKNLLASLREGILMCERQMEEEQRKLRRLQRGGLLVQNIISEEGDNLDDDTPRRSGRTKRSINYALLNELDIRISPPRPQRLTKAGSRNPPPSFSSTNFYNMRRTRHFQPEEIRKEKDEHCQLEVMTVSKQQDIDSATEDSEESSKLLCSFPLNSLSATTSLDDDTTTCSNSPCLVASADELFPTNVEHIEEQTTPVETKVLFNTTDGFKTANESIDVVDNADMYTISSSTTGEV